MNKAVPAVNFVRFLIDFLSNSFLILITYSAKIFRAILMVFEKYSYLSAATLENHQRFR